jgi:hypothetical protein
MASPCLLFLLLLPAIASASHYNAHAWKSASEYPTSADYPETELLSSRPSNAVAFTGGGSRSYLASLGYLAALKELDLTNIRYMSGVSGGSWATIVYTYKQTDVDDSIFLGPVLYPADLSMEKLQEMSPQCARALTDCDFVKVTVEALQDGTVVSLAEGMSVCICVCVHHCCFHCCEWKY